MAAPSPAAKELPHSTSTPASSACVAAMAGVAAVRMAVTRLSTAPQSLTT